MRRVSRAVVLLSAVAAVCVGTASAHGRPNRWVRAVSVRGGQISDRATEVKDASETPVVEGMSASEILSSSYNDLLGPELLSVADAKTGETEAVPTAEVLKGKHTALYFTSKAVEDQFAAAANNETSAQSFVRSAAVLKAVYAQAKADGHELEIIYVPVQDSAEQTKEAFKDMPWLSVVPNNSTTINLIRKTGVTVLPSVVILDPQGEVVTTDGYSNMAYFPDDFPWRNKNLKQLLGDKFEKADGSTVGAEALEGKVLGLYFSADWCAPCKQFTPHLIEAYKAIQEAGKNFEIIYIGGDKEESEQKGYVSKMPWLAIPFNSKHRAIVPRLLGVTALPTLLLFDEKSKLISANGRTDIMKEVQAGTPLGGNFPYLPKPLADLSDSPEYLARGPTLVAFLDGADKKEQARLMSVLKPIAESRAASLEAAIEAGGSALLSAPRKVAFLAATEIDQLSGAIRKLCMLDEIQGKWRFMKSKKALMKPRFALVSIVEGLYKVSEADELSEDSIKAFLSEFDNGTLALDKFSMPEEAGDEDQDNDPTTY